jgi:ABC-2 type transport system permease protein
MDKIKTIIDKEWAEVFKNKLVLFTVAFLPLLLVAMPLIMLPFMDSETEGMSEMEELPTAVVGQMCAGLDSLECVQVYMMSLFVLMFMILPVMVPVTIAAYSIVGEKTTRSLEPLLATPITTLELLTGKMLAAIIPAVVVTWFSYLLFMTGVWFMASTAVFQTLLAPMWLLAILVVGPLLAIFAVSIAIMVSSRVNDPRVAEQLSGAVIIPIILLLVGQSVGFLLLSPTLVLMAAVIVAVLDVGLVYLAIQTFERENILTRWK